jgi:hypothetical protein
MAIASLVFIGFGSGAGAGATPGQGDIHRGDIARGAHPSDGTIRFQGGRETVIYTATLAPGATSGWHRHPGAVVVLVKSGTLTTFGLDRPPCQGEDVSAGGAYFEDDAANARWPHFVRNRGNVPTEIVITAFNVPAGASPRTEAEAPKECADPM